MPVILDEPWATVVHGPWQETLEIAKARGGVDALIVDAPYSERTHSGHDDGAEATRFRPADERKMRVDKRTGAVYAVGKNRRRKIDYLPWQPRDVCEFARLWLPAVRGWWVSITDHTLARSWADGIQNGGRRNHCVFPPLPAIISGMTVRLRGDGPSSESVHVVVARPATAEFAGWGTLPGWYRFPAEPGQFVVGAKPLALMTALVRDYSRRGDVVCDPCSGGGTTARAARILGRRFIGGDCDEKAARETARVVSAAREQIALPFAADGG